MYRILVVMTFLTLITFTNLDTQAQEKKEDEKSQTTTIDAWRKVLPASEETSPTVAATSESDTNPEVIETTAQIESRVLELEKNMMEAIKGRDSATLKNLLAEDFLLTGINITGAKSDKTRYINWSVKNLELKSYSFDKTRVRAFPAAAIVSYNYKQQASIGGTPSDGDFMVTDVWVKRGNQWLVISRHISPMPKP